MDTHSPDDLDPETLARVLSAEGSAADIELVRRRAQIEPRLAAELESLERLWNLATQDDEQVDTRAGWQAIRARMRHSPAAVMPLDRREPSRRAYAQSGWPVPVAVAAGVMLVAAGVAGLYATGRLQTPDVRDAAAAPREFATAPGQRATLTLIDGTRVSISAATRLTIPADFGERTRDVVLEGEAYFEVAHDSLHPFVVRALHSATRVLGTKFGVRAYRVEAAVQVAVIDGRVALMPLEPNARTGKPNGAAMELALSPGLVGRIRASERPEIVQGADPARLLSWKDGKLVFQRVPLNEVLPELARWYGVDIHFAGTSAAAAVRPLSAELTDEPLAEALRMLEVALNVRAVRSGRNVTITPR